MIGRLINAAAIVITTMALLVVYQYWTVGTRLEAQLVDCLGG